MSDSPPRQKNGLTYAEMRAQKQAFMRDQNRQIMGVVQPPKPLTPPREPKKKAAQPKAVKKPHEPARAPIARAGKLNPSEVDVRNLEYQKQIDEVNRRDLQKKREAERHADRVIRALAEVEGFEAETLGKDEELKEELKRLTDTAIDAEEEDVPKAGTKASLESLQELLSRVELRREVKVTPKRIHSLLYHPDVTNDLIFAGDRDGHLALWKASENDVLVIDDDDDDESAAKESDGRVWAWRGHSSSTSVVPAVVDLKLAPGNRNSIFSASYDCTVRQTDFETSESKVVINTTAGKWEDGSLVHAIDFSSATTLFAVDSNGGITRRDLLEPMNKASRWRMPPTVESRDILGISINPARLHLAVTAHADKMIRFWDLRSLPSESMDALTTEQLNACLLHSHELGGRVSTATWDPSGTKLATTSYDDVVRVLDISRRKLRDGEGASAVTAWTEIEHGVRAGPSVSRIQAQWSTVPSLPLHLHVAHSERAINLYAPSPSAPTSLDGFDLAQLGTDTLKHVPAIIASHPTREGRYAGGNAVGKVCLFAPRDD